MSSWAAGSASRTPGTRAGCRPVADSRGDPHRAGRRGRMWQRVPHRAIHHVCRSPRSNVHRGGHVAQRPVQSGHWLGVSDHRCRHVSARRALRPPIRHRPCGCRRPGRPCPPGPYPARVRDTASRAGRALARRSAGPCRRAAAEPLTTGRRVSAECRPRRRAALHQRPARSQPGTPRRRRPLCRCEARHPERSARCTASGPRMAAHQ